MNFKTTHLALAAVLLLAAYAAPVHAETLTIKGTVANTPCSIVVAPVVLGSVPSTEFSGPNGASTPSFWKRFELGVAGCDISTRNAVKLKFEGVVAFGDPTILALDPVPAGALGYGVQVLTDDSTHGSGLKVRMDGTQWYEFNVNTTKNTFQFVSYYINPPGAGTRRTGRADAMATVTLEYS